VDDGYWAQASCVGSSRSTSAIRPSELRCRRCVEYGVLRNRCSEQYAGSTYRFQHWLRNSLCVQTSMRRVFATPLSLHQSASRSSYSPIGSHAL
jgi:hypothetical protein